MSLKVKGFVRHCFFGEYHAVIALEFESPEACVEGMPHLPTKPSRYLTAGGGYAICEGWRQLDCPRQQYAMINLAGPELEVMVDRFVELGADRKKILSMAKSIDYGEEFTFEIPVEDPNQMQLFENKS